jgi:hypothetical protein
LAIAAVAIAHEKRIGGTFVAHATAKTAAGKSSSHRFSSLLVRQFSAQLLPPIAPEIDGILARSDNQLMIRHDFEPELSGHSEHQGCSRQDAKNAKG